jgi:hypothetical protein
MVAPWHLLLILFDGAARVRAHGHLLVPQFRRTMAIGSQIRGYYVYHPFTNHQPHCVQGHCFGPTSFRCKDTAADTPHTTLRAGDDLTVSIYFQAFHPGDCSLYLSYDDDKVAPTRWFVLSHHPGCGGAGPSDTSLPDGSTLTFTISLPPWLPSCAHCVLRWEWTAVHVRSSRQLYVDCADVAVIGSNPEPTASVLARISPMVVINQTINHMVGNGHVRWPYGNWRREFGLQYMLGGQAVAGGALAVASLASPSRLPPPPGVVEAPPMPHSTPPQALPSANTSSASIVCVLTEAQRRSRACSCQYVWTGGAEAPPSVRVSCLS